jgi:hypothetical protein
MTNPTDAPQTAAIADAPVLRSLSVVERVARAMDAVSEWPAKTYRERHARAAIEAMREPTEAMQLAYMNSIDAYIDRVSTDLRFGRFDNHRIAFSAAIDAALEPETADAGGPTGSPGASPPTVPDSKELTDMEIPEEVVERAARAACESTSGPFEFMSPAGQNAWRIEARAALSAAGVGEMVKALEFYQRAWKFKTLKHRPGLEWSATEELLDDCGNRAKFALSSFTGGAK